MNSIYLHSELDLGHRGNYTPFTLLGIALFIGIILLFSLVTFKSLPVWIVPIYFIYFFATLAIDIVLLNKIIPNGHVLFQKGFEDIEVEIIVDKNTLISGEIVNFSYWWTNQRLFLELVCETGQNVILHEAMHPWESIPQNWQHSMKHFSSQALSYPTFKVKKMVDLLSRELGRG